MTSVPSWKVTPAMTFGNWFSPINRRQVFAAAMTSLNTISRAVVGDKEPLVHTVRCRSEHALDRICRPQMDPVLGGPVIEGQQCPLGFANALHGLRVARPEGFLATLTARTKWPK